VRERASREREREELTWKAGTGRKYGVKRRRLKSEQRME